MTMQIMIEFYRNLIFLDVLNLKFQFEKDNDGIHDHFPVTAMA